MVRCFAWQRHHWIGQDIYSKSLGLNKSGEVERTDVSEPIVETLTDSDWVPKLGPDFKVRET